MIEFRAATSIVACSAIVAGCGGSAANNAPQIDALDADTHPESGVPSGAWARVASGTAQRLNRVWGSGANDVWAVGAAGTVQHWNGSSWSHVASSTSEELHGVWGSGPDNVWTVGDHGTIQHFNGSVWAAASHPPVPGGVNGVWGSGPDNVWAVGDAGTILHGDGSSWTQVTSSTTKTLYSVWGSSAADVWTVGFPACISSVNAGVLEISCAGADVVHWNGTEWSVVSHGASLVDVWGSGPADVWVTGLGSFRPPTIQHWDGGAWSFSDGVALASGWFGVWGSGPNDVWAVGGASVHWNGSAWSEVGSGGEPLDLRGVWGSAASDIWAVGEAGVIVHR